VRGVFTSLLFAVLLSATSAPAQPARFGADAAGKGDALVELRAREAELARLDAEQTRDQARLKALASTSQELAAEIERVKSEPVGVRRDFQLQELLAAAKSKSDALDRLASELRGRAASLAQARRAVVAGSDRALAGQLPEATRLELSRLRTAQVTLLAQPPIALGRTEVEADPLDGPRELSEKADLLRDSEDKLRREVGRLGRRIDDVERRRHLRERAGSVDEDWFAESTSNRRVARVAGVGAAGGNNREGADKAGTADPARGGGASPPPAAPPGQAGAGSPPTGPTTGVGGPAAGGGGPAAGGGGQATGGGFTDSTPAGRNDAASVLRNLVDPSTLAELRRSDGTDDLERQLRALRRAHSELEGMARDLARRAHALSARAAELKKQK
jgi:hypothetical protein